jgi:1-acyl-sn-glycerol-3-phosphate acyltransferase
MKTTIFTTPFLSFVLRQISNLIMFLAGWRIKGDLPNIPKYVLIGAPHTSNWDFVLFLGLVFYLKVDVRYMGKAELFHFPYGWFFYYCGGVPVDRKNPVGLVEQMIEAANQSSKFILTIAPEGTRHKVTEWKSGFHRIATGAGIPIVMVKVDGANKIVHVGEIFHPTENMDADMKFIQESFNGIVGINPRKKYIPLQK